MSLDLIFAVGIILSASVLGVVIIKLLKNNFALHDNDIDNGAEFSLYVIKIIKGLINSYFEKYDGNNISKDNINKYINISIEALEYLQTLPNNSSYDEKIKEGMDIIKIAEKIYDIELNDEEKEIIKFVLDIIIRLYPEFIE